VAQRGINVDSLVGQQPVHLFDRVLGHPAPRQSEPVADRINRQGGCLDDAQGGIGQGQDALGVQIPLEQASEERKGPVADVVEIA